jgi:hypothetical protein
VYGRPKEADTDRCPLTLLAGKGLVGGSLADFSGYCSRSLGTADASNLNNYKHYFTTQKLKMSSGNSTQGPGLNGSLRDILKDLYANPYPEVENPVGCKKRASVALVLRIRPSYERAATVLEDSAHGASTLQHLDRFFSQSWVQNGDPECVFIKRAARVGDR